MNSTLRATEPRSSYKSVAFSDRFGQLIARRGHRQYTDSRAVSSEEARFLARKARHAIGAVASDDVLAKILRHNPQVIRMVERTDGKDAPFLAYLPLNPRGLDALANGRLNRADPDLALLTRADEVPVALYLWCLYAPGNFIPAIAAIAAHFESIAPGGVPLFASAANASAARLFDSLGFARATDHFARAEDDLLVVFRRPNGDAPTPLPAKTTVTRVTRTIEDVMKVFAIRAATYMNEQSCPYEEEYDGNDFCAAHILGEVGGEPAGCIRIRFFGRFVKLERLAVRQEFRSSTLAFRLVRAAIDYVREKGFDHVYGHARADLVSFWERFGFKAIPGRPPFEFSGVTYIEMEGSIGGRDKTVGIGDPPLVLIRPEGSWDRPGPLDRSAARAA